MSNRIIIDVSRMISNLAQVISLKPLSPFIIRLIKLISTILISSAIIWELGNLYAHYKGLIIPDGLRFIFWLDRVALGSHFVEALIAAYYTALGGQNPLKYGIYTFFVGTVGLLELKQEK
ncbi:hypothetical protein [Crocosphaera sp. XPORK-15E]|uniref:hypothetical protein n=1 Tax=Crocosphaera sp. XPORK-15E TaxID=3110247 RepID=UPI002B1EE2ED|nr:hypothetical protein [Crocosphaera sp. XPORK-15E]MEA5536349.1 hypothetical protein [Crocosphaera sp. XPORK-15E]